MKNNCFILMLVTGFSLPHSNTGAQIVNSGFEDTTSTGPEAWIAGPYGADFTSDHAHTGTNSLAVWNWYYYAQGFAVNGYDNGNFSGLYMDYGTPLNQIPNSLDGYYMYDTSNTTSNNDTAEIVVTCKRYNTVSQTREIIALGMLKLTATDLNMGFQPFSVPINVFTPGIQPDSILIVIRSSLNGFCNSSDGNCLYLYIDDLSLDLPTGTLDVTNLFSQPVVYPNPVLTTLNIKDLPEGTDGIRIYDAFGRLVLEDRVESDLYRSDGDWDGGLYTAVFCSDGLIIGRTKFVKK